MFLFKFDEEYFPVVFCIEIIGKKLNTLKKYMLNKLKIRYL